MKRIGLRELKNRLSHYVRQVRAGHEIQVTDRGEVVAELLPPRDGGVLVARAVVEDLALLSLDERVRAAGRALSFHVVPA